MSRAKILPLRARPRRANALTAFDPSELRSLLQLHSRKVASGEWRDYALDFTPGFAQFAAYARSSDGPLFRVQKSSGRQDADCAFALIDAKGQVLRRDRRLGPVLQWLERAASGSAKIMPLRKHPFGG